MTIGSTQTPAVAVTALRAHYDGRAVLAVDAWAAPAGAKGLVVGPSGSGKTTLLHLIAGLDAPREGRITVFGVDWAAMRPAARDRFRGRTLGLVFQTPRLLAALTLRANVALAARLAGRAGDTARLDALLERLDIAHCADRKPRTLSQGEAQRGALARALAGEPKLILADEPTSALDDARADAVAALLEDEAERLGATLLIVTHDARLKTRFETFLDLGARS